MKIGILFDAGRNNMEYQAVSISFVDNVDLMIDAKDAAVKMQEILDMHNNSYAETSSYIEHDKTAFFHRSRSGSRSGNKD